MKKLKIGILGAGSFARAFIPLFKAHPGVSAVSLAEVLPGRRNTEAAAAGLTETHDGLESLLRSDCDAVAIFTQRWMHGPQAIAALRAGKHVYSAVPMAFNADDMSEIIDLVRRTGLTYALGETSYYYPSTVLCRELWRQGKFGRFVYGEGEYMHDMAHGFYQAYQYSGGADWKRTAGVPPMLYPTHSVSMLTGVTGAHLTHVSCLGQVDASGDDVFGRGKNLWDNPYSNQTALCRTSDGGMFRINEFRRVGHWGGRSVRLSFFGTAASYEEQPLGDVLVTHDREVMSLGDLLRCAPVTEQDKAEAATRADGTQHDFYSGMALVHPRWRLPREYDGLGSGHHGSHQFLVDDFVRSCQTGALPPNHAWAAARYNLPGLIAHESAQREGEMLPIPDFGDAPAALPRLEDALAKVAPPLSWTLPKVTPDKAYWLT
jgi:predicted dehydrogenase